MASNPNQLNTLGQASAAVILGTVVNFAGTDNPADATTRPLGILGQSAAIGDTTTIFKYNERTDALIGGAAVAANVELVAKSDGSGELVSIADYATATVFVVALATATGTDNQYSEVIPIFPPYAVVLI